MSVTAEMGCKREGSLGRTPVADDEPADQLLGVAQQLTLNDGE